MALEGLKKHTRKMGVKGQGDLYGGSVNHAKWRDGVGRCGHYDTELDSGGFCRDQDCRRDRLIQALKDGRARKLEDGTIIWITVNEPGATAEPETIEEAR
jgi:hypothetical protein